MTKRRKANGASEASSAPTPPLSERGALEALRKRGYDVRLVRGDRETAGAYRVTVPAAVASR